jgi:hypothetical protein
MRARAADEDAADEAAAGTAARSSATSVAPHIPQKRFARSFSLPHFPQRKLPPEL